MMYLTALLQVRHHSSGSTRPCFWLLYGVYLVTAANTAVAATEMRMGSLLHKHTGQQSMVQPRHGQ